MTDADRQRIAAEWGIPIDQIPPATICPPCVHTPDPPQHHWKDQRVQDMRYRRRQQRMRALAVREGRQRQSERAEMGANGFSE
jgi:hypothetical protein